MFVYIPFIFFFPLYNLLDLFFEGRDEDRLGECLHGDVLCYVLSMYYMYIYSVFILPIMNNQ